MRINRKLTLTLTKRLQHSRRKFRCLCRRGSRRNLIALLPGTLLDSKVASSPIIFASRRSPSSSVQVIQSLCITQIFRVCIFKPTLIARACNGGLLSQGLYALVKCSGRDTFGAFGGPAFWLFSLRYPLRVLTHSSFARTSPSVSFWRISASNSTGARAFSTNLELAGSTALTFTTSSLAIFFLVFLTCSSGVEHITCASLAKLPTIGLFATNALPERILSSWGFLGVEDIPIQISLFHVFEGLLGNWNAAPVCRLLWRVCMRCGLELLA